MSRNQGLSRHPAVNPEHHPAGETITCWIYRSSRKDEMYLYLAKQDAFDDLPEGLLEQFGRPQRVMTLELHPGRALARADVTRVMANLLEQGFHLQLPPKLEPQLHYGE